MAKYLKHDSELGYIEDGAEIEYIKFNNLRHTIKGFMLGDFDQEGRYFVRPEIRDELISMRKFIIDFDDNMEVCRGELRLDKPITFLITYEGNKATLSLLEKIKFESNYKPNVGAYSNINEYILDEVETSGEINKNIIYQKWNVGEFGGQEIDIFSCDDAVLEKYFGIVNRFKYLLDSNVALMKKEEKLEEVEMEYGVRILDMLKLYPDLLKVVENEISTTIKTKKNVICADKPNFAKAINEIIDKTIEERIDLVKDGEREGFIKNKDAILRDINIKRADSVDVKFERIDTKKNQEDVIIQTINTNQGSLDIDNLDKVREDIKDSADIYASQTKLLEEEARKRAEQAVQTQEEINFVVPFVKKILSIVGGKEFIYSQEYIDAHTPKIEVEATTVATAPKAEVKKDDKKSAPAGSGDVKKDDKKAPAKKASATKSSGGSSSGGKSSGKGTSNASQKTKDDNKSLLTRTGSRVYSGRYRRIPKVDSEQQVNDIDNSENTKKTDMELMSIEEVEKMEKKDISNTVQHKKEERDLPVDTLDEIEIIN